MSSDGDLLGSRARARVDDRRQRVLAAQALGHQRALLVRRRARHGEGDVGPVEAGGHPQRVAQPEPARHVGRHPRRGRGGGGHERARAERAARRRRGGSSRAGSRAPTARRSGPRRPRTARRAPPPSAPGSPARRSARAPRRAAAARPPTARSSAAAFAPASCWALTSATWSPSPRAASASTWSCISATSGETTTVRSSRSSAGQLVAERLARAGGHDHEHVAARQRRLARLALARPEVGEAEELVERGGQIHGGEPP